MSGGSTIKINVINTLDYLLNVHSYLYKGGKILRNVFSIVFIKHTSGNFAQNLGKNTFKLKSVHVHLIDSLDQNNRLADKPVLRTTQWAARGKKT